MSSAATFGESVSALAPNTAYEYQICGREGAWEAGRWACVGRDLDSNGLGDEDDWQPMRTATEPTVAGSADTNSALTIEPSGRADSVVRSMSNWDSTVAFIQRMPKTRRVQRVTLGDFSLADSCTDGTSVQLFVDEHPTGDIGTRNQLTYSQTPQGSDLKSPIPSTPGRVTWSIPPSTFKEGSGYSFRIAYPTGCSAVKQFTWGHGARVNPGPDKCAEGPRVDASSNSPAQQRMWHVKESSDAQAPCVTSPPANPAFFSPSMPTGWLVTRSGYGYVLSGTNFSTVPDASSTCTNQAAEAGARPVYWRDSPGRPGLKDYVCMWPSHQFAQPGTQTPTGWRYAVPWRSVDGARPREAYTRLETVDYNGLLLRHAPVLRYDAQETFFADSAETITNNYQDDGRGANVLRREEGSLLASADPQSPIADLGLTFLRPGTYPNGAGVTGTDSLDLRGDESAAGVELIRGDAARMHADPLYRDKGVYARAVHDDRGDLWLQYWFFYYFNSLNFAGEGDHEGDWEMIQLRLGNSTIPDDVTYSRHTEPDQMRCDWPAVEKAPIKPEAPVVYVANGSHASYYARGTYGRGLLPADVAEGRGREVPHAPQIMHDDAGWVGWPGHWGADRTGVVPGGGSPLGFLRKGAQWTNPRLFHRDAGSDCVTDGSGDVVYPSATAGGSDEEPRVVKSQPRKPEIVRVRSKGDRAVITYRLASTTSPRFRRPVRLFATVHPREKALAPSARELRVSQRAGTLSVDLPEAGQGPYTVRLRAAAERGVSSEVASARLR